MINDHLCKSEEANYGITVVNEKDRISSSAPAASSAARRAPAPGRPSPPAAAAAG